MSDEEYRAAHQLDDRFTSRFRRALGMMRLYRNPFSAYRHRFIPTHPTLVTHAIRNGPVLTVHAGPADIRIINEIWLARCYETDPRFIPLDEWHRPPRGPQGDLRCASLIPRAQGEGIQLRARSREFRIVCGAHVGERAIIHNVAVGSKQGVAELYRIPRMSGLNSIVAERALARGYEGTPLEVELASLVQIIAEAGHVDLLKIDVEGTEMTSSSGVTHAPSIRLIESSWNTTR
jgi:hypothetical protein